MGWGDDFETSLWKEVDGEKWKEVERSGEKRREVVRISRWRQVLRGQLIEASLTCRKLSHKVACTYLLQQFLSA